MGSPASPSNSASSSLSGCLSRTASRYRHGSIPPRKPPVEPTPRAARATSPASGPHRRGTISGAISHRSERTARSLPMDQYSAGVNKQVPFGSLNLLVVSKLLNVYHQSSPERTCPFHLFHRASQRRLGSPARTSFWASGFCNRPWARSSRYLFRRIVPANLCKGMRMPAASTSPQRGIDLIRAGVVRPQGVRNDDADRRPWARKRPFRTRPAERVVHPVCPCRATSGSLNRDNSRGMSQECAANAAR